MKRGFFNTPRYKRAIDEAYAPAPVPEPEVAHRGKPPTSLPASQDAMDVDKEVCVFVRVQYTDGRVVRPADDTKPEGEVGEPHPTESKSRSKSGDPKPEGKGKGKAIDMEDDPMGDGKRSPKKQGKKKAIGTDDDDDPTRGKYASMIPPRPTPGRLGWGRCPEEEFFHTVPQSHGGPSKKRVVFRFWPRKRNSKPLQPTKLRGTLSPDGYVWGETLYDFYYVNRLPSVDNFVSISTGSMLRQVMESMSELDAAAPEIEWAKTEGQPRVEGVADTEEQIRLRLWEFANPSSQDRAGAEKQFGEQDQQDEQVSENNDDDEAQEYGDDELPTFIPSPPTIPVTSPFHPSHYPTSWPLIPFENSLPSLLQERIPLYLLPETLYVHDPFCLLSARERRFRNTSWASRSDIIRTYNLNTSESVRLEIEDARLKAVELEEFKARMRIRLRYKRTEEQIKNHEPIIEVPLPPYPRRMMKLEESHLYLSPVAKVGKGHHSVVYKGEWELPRDLFTKERICQFCFKESVDKEIQRLKDTGRWDEMLRAASWGPDGFTGGQPTKVELDAVHDPPNLARDGEITGTFNISSDIAPSRIVEFLDEMTVWDQSMKRESTLQLHFGSDEDGDGSADGSYVPVFRIDPPFSYESQKKSCTHAAHTLDVPTPRTAKFTVVAKLSLENDPHLDEEATNYENFPEHFFHHYNGYTLISQLKAIVPVNAVVPQFYGYYTPKREEEENSGEPSYLSPILLLEHCGKPIEPEELSPEDQEECASLLLRFENAGWLHESVAPRNFLVQLGKPTEFPMTRMVKPEQSFRLIDFGRSRKYTTATEKREEEMRLFEMFESLSLQMGVTLGR
ncbi:hypothetical protein JVT61DRAFT_11782 [Boletus reticuloceps]|uniref:Protein kinase domain-containing protein n=1 Tax=Boletus reticuloceps TaxID=495285 RepID=A0A8I3ADD8_9AGAM|nr:hypothetical protein JVT61DRAFT_11782 [Boletus reticuloceps]